MTSVDPRTFQLLVIASGLKLYAATGMKPNRAYTPKAMMAAAAALTGKTYKPRAYLEAAADLTRLAQPRV